MTKKKETSGSESTRRDFITMTASSMAAVGGACAVWPMVDSLNPSKDVLAQASIEVDLSQIAQGQNLTVKWRGKPVFIRHRTDEEMAQFKSEQTEKMTDLVDPESDADRITENHERWLVVIGICTHLGCVPIWGQGEYSGWFCPCHGSHYDALGRIRKGPAPMNLEVPEYKFLSDTKIKIG
jgi:ubiquinol-cytochrome c reductase iron-sulfur subunit